MNDKRVELILPQDIFRNLETLFFTQRNSVGLNDNLAIQKDLKFSREIRNCDNRRATPKIPLIPCGGHKTIGDLKKTTQP
jgi:hypothetical protein